MRFTNHFCKKRFVTGQFLISLVHQKAHNRSQLSFFFFFPIFSFFKKFITLKMAFSSALVLTDLNDFIAPSQACIKPVEVVKGEDKGPVSDTLLSFIV
jgi:hypothetical protein